MKTYETDNLIIYWKPELCQHSANCIDGDPEVFDVERRPWIKPENGKDEDIMKIIDTCPSKALTYKVK